MIITFFDSTGKITGRAGAQETVMEVIKEMAVMPFVEGDYFDEKDTKYVVDGVVVPRPENPSTLVGLDLANLPIPSEIIINGSSRYPCTDSTATLSFNLPGIYKIKVEAWPYLDKEFTYVNPA